MIDPVPAFQAAAAVLARKPEDHLRVLSDRRAYLLARDEVRNPHHKAEIAALTWAIDQLTPT